ncbi:MAG: carotenoid biosynthesis protein [Bacteroidales bacterium]|jgi:putative membrane protein|nr:carotenoid biosynthesis protein [Bacteroidales bacterium]NLM93320.1 carotenoid biosynthesis protein [Bacteroidales bacterium]
MTIPFMNNKVTLTKALLILYFSVGVIGLIWPLTAPLFTRLIPLTLLGSLAVLLAFHQKWLPGHIRVFALVAILGYLVELAGVATGLVFGEYQYHEALGFKLFGTPLIIGINWLLLIYAVYGIFEKHLLHPAIKIFAGATLMVAYDIILEPVAVALKMWSWGGGDIPLQNYLAWFVISLVFLTIFHLAKIRANNPIARQMYLVQLAFFLLLNVYFRLA